MLQGEEGLNSKGNMPRDEGEISQGEYLNDKRKISYDEGLDASI